MTSLWQLRALGRRKAFMITNDTLVYETWIQLQRTWSWPETDQTFHLTLKASHLLELL
jgi:hypothetical protein